MRTNELEQTFASSCQADFGSGKWKDAENLQHPPANKWRQTCGSAQTKLFLGSSSLARVKSGLNDKSNQEFLNK